MVRAPTAHPSSHEGLCPAKLIWTHVFGAPRAHPACSLGGYGVGSGAQMAAGKSPGRERSPPRWGAGSAACQLDASLLSAENKRGEAKECREFHGLMLPVRGWQLPALPRLLPAAPWPPDDAALATVCAQRLASQGSARLSVAPSSPHLGTQIHGCVAMLLAPQGVQRAPSSGDMRPVHPALGI